MFQLGGKLPPVAKLFGALPRRAAGGGGGVTSSALATKPIGPLSLAAVAGATVRAACPLRENAQLHAGLWSPGRARH